MKKFLLQTLFISALLFCFPNFVLGAAIELTVNVNNVQMPERSTIMLTPDYPNTEFMFCNTRIVVVDKNVVVSATASFPNVSVTTPPAFTCTSSLKKGAQKIFYFAYDPASAPYNAHLEIEVRPQSSYTYCATDCSPVASGSGGYYTFGELRYLSTLDSGWYRAVCPTSYCNPGAESRRYYLGFPAESGSPRIFSNYWRSPSILTIN